MIEKLTEPKFKRRLLAHFFVRFHMTLILSAVCLSGVLTSKALLVLGLRSMLIRYVIAIGFAYILFFFMMRLWLWYIGINPRARSFVQQTQNRKTKTSSITDVISFDIGSVGSGSESGWSGFGGGSSGGGGASDSWEAPMPTGSWLASTGPMSSSGSSSLNISSSSDNSAGSWLDFDLGDDGFGAILLLLLLIALVLGIFGAGFYLIYQAPAIFAEAAFQAALASGLIKASNKIEAADWKGSVFKATWIPLVVVLVLAMAFGIAARRYCPAATRATEVFSNCK